MKKFFLHPLFFIGLALLIFSLVDETLLMPDHLSTAHGSLENNCKACHPGFKGTPDSNCLACKGKMSLVLETGIHKYAPVKKCSGCHQEHLGKNYPIAEAWIDPVNFNHNWTGFDLSPFHLNLACTDCHQAKGNYRHTPRQCGKCHRDFKPGLWNHAKVGCRLTPPHKDLPCRNCHTKGWGGDKQPTCSQCHPPNTYKPRMACASKD
ncbi:hypothetical protein [Dethiosulfatarculus sandiegensis]|uniref:Uncharacterized protein n=1 Tax=Dethiosulfatarculus sandiegensis TaxID=1429043 RepID=A0A0D2JG08_9BACT|nr:hypothetical protein [Dethiosulfatarculus sandiegensis]KIX14646.1 hypothetical protein X474_08130 [Dethiosulfatarculus sandiegensis]